MSTNINFIKSLGLGLETRIDLPAFDVSYKAILDRAIFLGYSLPSIDQQTKQNTFLVTLKSAGVWNKLDVLYVFAQNGGSQFATLNWKNPSANQSTLSSPTPPTFVTNGGFQGNGVDSFIDTNFNPATQGVQYTLNNASRYFFTHAISGSGRFDGNTNAGINSMLRASTTQHRINAGSSNLLATSFDFTATVNTKSIHRTSSVDVTLYNETTGVSNTQTSTTVQSANQFILRSGTTYAAHTCAAYAMGASMISENKNFLNAWNIYKSSI